jgi:hypothetical protein
MELTEIVCVGVEWIHLVHNRRQWRALGNFRGYMQRADLFTKWTVNFSRILPHAITRVHNFNDTGNVSCWMRCRVVRRKLTTLQQSVFIYVHHKDVWAAESKLHALSRSAQDEGMQSPGASRHRTGTYWWRNLNICELQHANRARLLV